MVMLLAPANQGRLGVCQVSVVGPPLVGAEQTVMGGPASGAFARVDWVLGEGEPRGEKTAERTPRQELSYVANPHARRARARRRSPDRRGRLARARGAGPGRRAAGATDRQRVQFGQGRG